MSVSTVSWRRYIREAVEGLGEYGWKKLMRIAHVGINSYSRLKKLEYGPRTIDAGLPSSSAFGVWGQSYSNFLASAVLLHNFEIYATCRLCKMVSSYISRIRGHNVGN